MYTVMETEQVILTQFGKPIGDPITEPGLHFKMPFVQKVNRVDKRILEWDGESWSVEPFRVAYDHEAVAAEIVAQGTMLAAPRAERILQSRPVSFE